MLNWSKRFNIFCFLDNNNYQFESPRFECILAAGSQREIKLRGAQPLTQLQRFHDESRSWLFGHLAYDLNGQSSLPSLSSSDFGQGFFFEPEIIVRLGSAEVYIQSITRKPDEIYSEILSMDSDNSGQAGNKVKFEAGITENDYVDKIEKLKDHIRRGDCYEINFCQYFKAEEVMADPHYLYHQLASLSPNPFSAFYNMKGQYCICASPERYLKFHEGDLISQPIKGTIKRDANPETDKINRNYLQHSSKERSENVMIVDLVRNDLSRVCERGSVKVKELFGVYAFPQVYQMISTITGRASAQLDWTRFIGETFPMGSMTGAPKKRVMELIELYEPVSRGLFSGAIGYVTPSGEFDFNVVIRSLFHNKQTKELSFYAGGGITFYSDPKKEYEECLVKAEAIMKVLEGV